jgi:hypothetical protein
MKHVAGCGKQMYTEFWLGRHHFKDLGIDWMIILSLIFGKYVVEMWLGLKCLKIALNSNICERDEDSPGSIKQDFWLTNNYEVLKINLVLWYYTTVKGLITGCALDVQN